MTSLFNLIKSTLTDWPLGTLVGIVMIAAIILVIFLILSGIFIAIDSWFQPRKHAPGKVVGKKFTPARTTIVMVSNGKYLSPIPIHHPDNWSVTIEVDDQCDSMSVSHKAYDSVSIGTQVEAEYVAGRISGGFYVKAFRHI